MNVKLAKSTIEEWDEYREEQTGFSSRSEFVRFAVNREMNGKHEPKNATQEYDNEALEQMQESVNELTEGMGTMQEQIEQLSNAVSSDPKTDELADRIFTILPDEEPGSHGWDEQRESYLDNIKAIEEGHTQGDIDSVKSDYEAWKGTPEGLSEALDEPLRKIHVALDKLITETHLIRTEESEEGETRYWKEV